MTSSSQAVSSVVSLCRTLRFVTSSSRIKEHGVHVPSPDAPLLLVACSGGRDSLALVWACAKVAGMYGLRYGAVVVDHGLQEGSDVIATQAAEQCAALGASPVVVRRVTVDEDVACHSGTEAAARSVRYAALADVAQEVDAAVVLLAHTMTDTAENVMMGILRGSSVRSVQSIPPIAVVQHILFARPFMTLTREDTTKICAAHDIPWWDDPTNGETNENITSDLTSLIKETKKLPLRSRTRCVLFPVLRHLGGDAVQNHLSSLGEDIREDSSYLDNKARAAFVHSLISLYPPTLDVIGLRRLHPAIRRRVLRFFILKGFDFLSSQDRKKETALISKYVAALENIVMAQKGKAKLDLPSHLVIERIQKSVKICNNDPMEVQDCSQYVDHVLISHDEIEKRMTELAHRIDEDYSEKNPYFISILKGGMNTLMDLTMKMHITAPLDFMSISTYGKQHQSTGEIALRTDLSGDVAGKDVLIVEDIIDTGFTLDWVTRLLKERGARSVEILTLLNKKAHRTYDLPVKYVGFDINDEFVVGYGLDYNEDFRNLDSIVVFKPEEVVEKIKETEK